MGNVDSKRDGPVYTRLGEGLKEIPAELVRGKRRDAERINLSCNKYVRESLHEAGHF